MTNVLKRPEHPPVTPAGSPSERALAVVRAVHADVARLAGEAVPLRLWDGSLLGPADAPFRIVLCHPWSLRTMLLAPTDLAAGEAYVCGDIDVEGDIVAAMTTGARAASALLRRRAALRLAHRLLALPRPPRRAVRRDAHLRGHRHSVRRDRAAIAFHYDLPQAFYEAFLDADLVYSCAYFAHPAQELEDAQLRKLDLVCRKLRLRPGLRLLDIGCGWGSLLLHAARHYGVAGLGVTLSRTQLAVARRRVEAAGLADRLEIRLQDYRELARDVGIAGSAQRFDAVASVGMVEHVGVARLPEYFGAAYRLTAPGGLFLNHGIVAADRRWRGPRRPTFVSRYVFPDGELSPAWRAARELEQAGFELVDAQQLRPHYPLTLRAWIQRLEANHDAAAAAASEMDYRVWRAYMAGSVRGFETGNLGVVQLMGSKGADLPLDRSWMLRDGQPPAPPGGAPSRPPGADERGAGGSHPR